MKNDVPRTTAVRSWPALRSRITGADRAWLSAQTADVRSSAPTAVAAVDPASTTKPWWELDDFLPPRRRTGSRFDDTVALPIDAPRRLEEILHAADLRLRALPPVSELGHRTIAYRARLQHIARDAAQARKRLAEGSYGSCVTCTGDISLAVLTDRPWAPQCTYCELDI